MGPVVLPRVGLRSEVLHLRKLLPGAGLLRREVPTPDETPADAGCQPETPGQPGRKARSPGPATGLPALLVPPVGGPPLLPPRFPPAALAAVSVAPVTMTADPKHHTTAGPPAKPLTQCLFAGPHPRPCGGTGQPRPGMAILIPSTDDAAPFFRAGAKTPDRRLTAGVFSFRLRPRLARASASLTDDEDSTSRYRRSSKKTQPCSLLSLVPFFPLRR